MVKAAGRYSFELCKDFARLINSRESTDILAELASLMQHRLPLRVPLP